MKTPRFLFLAFTLLTLISCNAHHSQNSFNSESKDISISSQKEEPIKNHYDFSFIDNKHVLGTGEQISLETKLFCNEKEIRDYSVTFTTPNVDVASVNKDGVVTANGEGTTKIKARVNEYDCEPIFYDLTVYQRYQKVDILNENIVNYYGRVHLKDDKAYILNTASAFELSFYGTSLNATFNEGIGLKIRIYIDNKDTGTKLIEKDTKLCANLTKDIHIIKVVRCNYEYRGVISLASIYGAEYYLKAPERPHKKLEFYGDSITVGAGINADGSGDTIANEDGTLTYAYRTMLHYNAEANYLAFDGATVMKAPWRYWTYESQYTNYSLISDMTPWDFNKFIPHYLIINLGTNDAGIVNRGEGILNELSESYISFLTSIRSHYERNIIVCCYGMMGVDQDISYTINSAVIKMNDPNIHYFEFTPVSCTGNEYHPDVNGSIDGANQLIGFIDGLTYNEQFDDSSYEVSQATNCYYNANCVTYAIKLNKPLSNVFGKINIGKANQKITGGITVVNSPNCIHVFANSVSAWFKPNGDSTSGYYNMNEWASYSDKSDKSNYIYFRLYAKPGEKLSTEAMIYVSFEDYVEPVEGVDYSISQTTEVTYGSCTIFKILDLRENNGFDAAIRTSFINKQLSGAIMVSSTERWVNVKTTGYNKWFRNYWSQGDWWEGTNQWDEFSYKTGSDGVINLKIGIYTEENAGAYGPIVPGVAIYVAVNG